LGATVAGFVVASLLIEEPGKVVEHGPGGQVELPQPEAQVRQERGVEVDGFSTAASLSQAVGLPAPGREGVGVAGAEVVILSSALSELSVALGGLVKALLLAQVPGETT
jgi:hypothetical protein